MNPPDNDDRLRGLPAPAARGKRLVRIQVPPLLMDLFREAGIGGAGKTYTDFITAAIETYPPEVNEQFADRSKGRPRDEGFESFRVELESALYARVTDLSSQRIEYKKRNRGKIHYTSIKSILEETIARKFANEWEELGLKNRQRVQDATGLSTTDVPSEHNRARGTDDQLRSGRARGKHRLEEQDQLSLDRGRSKEFVSKGESSDFGPFRRILAQIIHDLPIGYTARREQLGKLSDSFREEIARAFEPVLNDCAASLPQATYEEKKTIAKWINAELRQFGLALKAPKTGHPCFLVATTGDYPEIGRFVFDYVDESGKRQHPMSSATLPRLEVMLADLTRAPYGHRVAARR